MGVVDRARGGRRRGRRLRARRAPGDPRGVRAVRRRRGLPRWAARTRSPRWPTAPRRVARVDVIAGPGNLYVQEAKRQVSRRRRASTASPGPSDVLVLAAGGRRPGARGARPAGPGRARRGHDRRAPSATTPALLDAIDARARATAGRARSCDAPDLEAALAFAEAFAPEHLELVGRRGRGARAARAQRRLRVRRARERHGVRRLRRGLEPHAADRRRGALRLRAVARATSAGA